MCLLCVIIITVERLHSQHRHGCCVECTGFTGVEVYRVYWFFCVQGVDFFWDGFMGFLCTGCRFLSGMLRFPGLDNTIHISGQSRQSGTGQSGPQGRFGRVGYSSTRLWMRLQAASCCFGCQLFFFQTVVGLYIRQTQPAFGRILRLGQRRYGSQHSA